MNTTARLSTPVQGLRTRYFPKSRLGHGFISAVPWLNVLLLFFFYYWLSDKMVMQPGTALQLTAAPLTSATRSTMTAVLQPAASVAPQESPLLYFDDHVFHIGQIGELDAFSSVLSAATAGATHKSLVLYVDSSFTFDVVNSIINIARASGVEEVNLASQPLTATVAREP